MDITRSDTSEYDAKMLEFAPFFLHCFCCGLLRDSCSSWRQHLGTERGKTLEGCGLFLHSVLQLFINLDVKLMRGRAGCESLF